MAWSICGNGNHNIFKTLYKIIHIYKASSIPIENIPKIVYGYIHSMAPTKFTDLSFYISECPAQLEKNYRKFLNYKNVYLYTVLNSHLKC